MTIPAGTLLQVRTNEPLDTKKTQPGDYFQATVIQSVYQGRFIAIPRGAQVTGRVVDVKKPGDLKGSAGFTLVLTSLNLGAQSVALATIHGRSMDRARGLTRRATPWVGRPSAP